MSELKSLIDEVQIRPLTTADSMAELTGLLHRAYAQLAAQGFRYVATWQDEDTTRRRCSKGECYVAEHRGRVIGTITLVTKPSNGGSTWYERPDVAAFRQFGIEPACQRQGIGSKMMDFIERRAMDLGLAELALDTAEGATHLIEWYQSRGYRFIEYVKWDVTNYRSVILSRPLGLPEISVDEQGRHVV